MSSIGAMTVDSIREHGGLVVVFTAAELGDLAEWQKRSIANALVQIGNEEIEHHQGVNAREAG
ncbi:hypothetical protein J2T57_001598 [Natronocella acetinitrilica]|uniref:Uncharacterized protein n=1 Tax=Natronocella acetinitrilica TaxID=414046 RepID=A0AAE3KBC2_9GAMM|nr:hypothetical protein [Natronocella acetinitrilica]MCP1674496.1 hypothetical protein [Natronocella acetinitrilica]